MHPDLLNNDIQSILSKITDDKQIEIKIIPSYSCDKKCSYCYNNIEENNYFSFKEGNILSTLDDIFNYDRYNAVVEIIGGEPLSRDNYLKTIDIINQLKKYDSDIKIVIQTASSSIKDIINIVPMIDGLSYSIDISSSPKVVNIKNLEQLTRECKLNSVLVQIQTVLNMSDNLKNIFQFLHHCESYNVGWIGIGFPQYSRYSENDLNIQIEIYRNIIENINEFSEMRIGGAIIESVLDYLNSHIYCSSCMCGEKSITIQPNGLITPSLHLSLSNMFSFKEFTKLKKIRRLVLRNQICRNCKIWDICYGGCMAHAYFLTGEILQKDTEYCYVLSHLLDGK